jgi:hypothetical protein
MATPEQIETIRRLNDAARQNLGIASLANVTIGFQSLTELDRLAALVAITRYSRWDGDNDPYGEHDFGAVYKLASGAWSEDRSVEVGAIAQTVFWKVDYYDPSLTDGSEAPWDERLTKRVLTIMLASEY